MQEAKSRKGFVAVVIKLLLELGETVVHFVEIMGIRRWERIVKAIELGENINGGVTLRDMDRTWVIREVLKKMSNRSIQGTSTRYALAEHEAKSGDIFAVIKVCRKQVSECSIGICVEKSLVDAISVGAQYRRQTQVMGISNLALNHILDLHLSFNHVSYLIVRIVLQSETVLVTEI